MGLFLKLLRLKVVDKGDRKAYNAST